MEKILVIDDNPDIVEIYTVRLKAAGYEVISSLKGAEALEKAREEKPDLIILDIAMPAMDGFETGIRLKEDFATAEIPIIMATASSAQADIVKAVSQLGAVAYMIKPFNPDVLLKEVAKALGKIKKEQ